MWRGDTDDGHTEISSIYAVDFTVEVDGSVIVIVQICADTLLKFLSHML